MGELTSIQIGIAVALIVGTITLSRVFGLQLEKTFGVAALRCVVQLSLIGYALRWIFDKESVALNLFALSAMTLVAAQTVVSRVEAKSWRLFGFACVALIGGVWSIALPSIRGLFGESAIFEAKLFIPLMGLLLGNALSGISLTFIQLQKVRRENLREIETFRALGGTGWESCARLYRAGLKQALTPILNAMSVVGLVSLPGTMAGQVLGGVDPLLAGRVQIVIMLLILLTSLIGALIAIGLFHAFEMPDWVRGTRAARTLADGKHQKFGISGSSGIGKSRFLKSLAGLDERCIAEKSIYESNTKFEARDAANLVYLSQHPTFIPGTVRENLELPFHFVAHIGKSLDKEELRAQLAELQLSEEILQKSAMTLSGGEAQIVNLLRALTLNPLCLLLDEPTSALDSMRWGRVENLLLEWALADVKRSYVLVSHDRDQRRRLCDRQWVFTREGLIRG